jgi:hypothetical protein
MIFTGIFIVDNLEKQGTKELRSNKFLSRLSVSLCLQPHHKTKTWDYVDEMKRIMD